MKVRLVTGYVPLRDHPRTPAEYGALGEQLGGVPVPKKAFYMPVEETWLYQFLSNLQFPVSVSRGDNPAKNTVEYHCVNHQKTEWLSQAADAYPDDDVFVWVDYGIFSQPGICNQIIAEMFDRIDGKDIAIPGCRPKGIIEAAEPCWRFCGSVLVCPRDKVALLDTAAKSTAISHILATKNVEWEVNTWARLEQKRLLPIRWYKADHNETLFTGYQPNGDTNVVA